MARRSNTRTATKVLRTRKSSLLLGIVLALFVALVYHAIHRQTASIPGAVQEELGGIHIAGIGGDPDLNRQKNRLSAPTQFEELTPSQLTSTPDGVLLEAGKRRRNVWSSDAHMYLDRMEDRGARLTGYIIAAKESGPESCNGFIDSLRDYHIWIGDSAMAPKASSVVVEVTPRWKAIHPEWKLQYFQALSRQHAKVRVTGWVLWDEEHPNEVGHSRSTCWEIHPITRFEVFTSGQWQELNGDVAEK